MAKTQVYITVTLSESQAFALLGAQSTSGIVPLAGSGIICLDCGEFIKYNRRSRRGDEPKHKANCEFASLKQAQEAIRNELRKIY